MSALTLWTRRDPFTDAFVRNFLTVPDPRTVAAQFVPAAEVSRDGDDAVLRLELPGLDVDKDVTVEVSGGRLVVRGDRRDEHTDTQGLREIRYGSFRRTFAMPQHLTADAVSATYDAGVLTVRITGAYTDPTSRTVPVAVASTTNEAETPAA
jgi:HSP20 family molecular chaperone IbpA